MAMDGPKTSGADRQAKHAAIVVSLQQLEGVTRKIEGMVDRIQGSKDESGMKEEAAALRHSPSLLEVLNETPVQVHGCCDRIAKALAQISDMIF